MIDFRGKRKIRPGLGLWLAGFMAALTVWPVHGQEEDGRKVTGPPVGIAPTSKSAVSSDGSGTRILGDRPGMRDGGIQVGTLSRLTDTGVGLLTEATGGFSRDMWQGSERLVLDTLIPKLPTATVSPVLNDLARRLLLTEAPMPEGVTSGGSAVAMRLERLVHGGHFEDVLALAGKIKNVAAIPELLPPVIKAQLMMGRSADACQTSAQTQEGRDQPFWLKLRTICFVLNNEPAAADLTAGLLRDQGVQDDTFFTLVNQATSGTKLELPQNTGLDAFGVVLLADTGGQVDQAVLARTRPGVLAVIAGDDRFDMGTRLAAALRAAKFGALDVEALGVLFDSVEFSEEQIKTPLTSIADLDAATSHALLYRSFKTSTVPSASAELLATAMIEAKSQGVYATLAGLYWPVVRGLQPRPAFAGVAVDMVRIALVGSNVSRAYDWYNLVRQSADIPQHDVRDVTVLLASFAPSERLAWQPSTPSSWLNAAGAEFGRRVKEVTLLEGLGYPIANTVRIQMLEGASQSNANVASSALMSRMARAIQTGRFGEALLVSLVALDAERPERTDARTLLDVFNALSALDLDDGARRMIFDALLAGQMSFDS